MLSLGGIIYVSLSVDKWFFRRISKLGTLITISKTRRPALASPGPPPSTPSVVFLTQIRVSPRCYPKFEVTTITGMKKCEMFGCRNTGVKMYRLGPATTVWLCADCFQIEIDKS